MNTNITLLGSFQHIWSLYYEFLTFCKIIDFLNHKSMNICSRMKNGLILLFILNHPKILLFILNHPKILISCVSNICTTTFEAF